MPHIQFRHSVRQRTGREVGKFTVGLAEIKHQLDPRCTRFHARNLLCRRHWSLCHAQIVYMCVFRPCHFLMCLHLLCFSLLSFHTDSGRLYRVYVQKQQRRCICKTCGGCMFGLVAAECAAGVPVLPAHSAATNAGHLGHSDNLDSSRNRRRRAA